MSREFIFFPAVKRDGKYEPYAEINGGPLDIMWRNARGLESMRYDFPSVRDEELGEGFRRYFGETAPGDISVISDPESLADSGLVTGYVKHEEMTDCDEPHMIAPEIMAELPDRIRMNYGHVAYVDTASIGYICSVLSEFAWSQSEKIEFLMLFSY